MPPNHPDLAQIRLIEFDVVRDTVAKHHLEFWPLPPAMKRPLRTNMISGAYDERVFALNALSGRPLDIVRDLTTR